MANEATDKVVTGKGLAHFKEKLDTKLEAAFVEKSDTIVVGDTAPTDENVKYWLDTSDEQGGND